MANTFTLSKVKRGEEQFQGIFSEVFLVTIACSDQDAINDDVSVKLSFTVPGVQLGDMVLGISANKAQSDANAQIIMDGWVSAANTLELQLTNIDDATDAYDNDVLTGGELKVLIGRPIW